MRSDHLIDRLPIFPPAWYDRAGRVARFELPRSRRAESMLVGVLGRRSAVSLAWGGGAVMVPLLTGRMGLNQHRAHGTSLAIYHVRGRCRRAAVLARRQHRLAGVLGVGGGTIFVPAIVILGLADAGGEDPQKIAQGVSLVVIVATGAFGTVTNLRQETVDLAAARWIAPAAVVAALFAALTANRVDAEVLKRIYGVTALLLGIETMYTSWRMMQAERAKHRA